MKLCSRDKTLSLDSAKVMGILNVTPDSFSDGGSFLSLDAALFQAEMMVNEGAAIIDVGGESTRPGAQEVSGSQEIDRVIPIIEKIKNNIDCWVSVDTSKTAVMVEAINHQVDMINDVRSLTEKGALETVINANIPVCLMHRQGEAKTMQNAPYYDDVVKEVKSFLLELVHTYAKKGLKKEHIILDLGFGFGKTLAHNLTLLKAIEQFQYQGFPILTGLSRKSMFGELLNRDTKNRLAGSLAGVLIAAQQGSKILRVHDVPETIDVLKVLKACDHI